MKSALFVDFDNVFSGLRLLDPTVAERFAMRPLEWIRWLTESLPAPEHAAEGAARRLQVRRCYLNPQVSPAYSCPATFCVAGGWPDSPLRTDRTRGPRAPRRAGWTC